MELSKLSGYKLYMMRNSDNAKEIDAELDRRNRQASKKTTRKGNKVSGMIDSHYENNRWFIEDDGTIKKVSA